VSEQVEIFLFYSSTFTLFFYVTFLKVYVDPFLKVCNVRDNINNRRVNKNTGELYGVEFLLSLIQLLQSRLRDHYTIFNKLDNTRIQHRGSFTDSWEDFIDPNLADVREENSTRSENENKGKFTRLLYHHTFNIYLTNYYFIIYYSYVVY